MSVAVRYLDAWLGGTGAVAIDGLMEDAATADIARCQVWQWLHHITPLAEDLSPFFTARAYAVHLAAKP
ncbi:hypothetical protein [Actinokineospora pegani]|uniref:hypothetical protein n=1 Tax=Actinokineospora pegani TaxID=2654637 RepID=UPI0038B35FAF